MMTPKNLWPILRTIPLVVALALAGCSDNGEGTLTEPAIDTTPPGVPIDFGVRGSPQDGILVQWAANSEPDLAGYILERSLDRGWTWSAVSSSALTTPSYRDSYHTRADYRVAAVDLSQNQSAFSRTATYIFVSDRGGKYPSQPADPN